MGGPTSHGQKNKAHKAGRAAGLSSRQKQRLGKEVGPSHRQPAKAGASQGGRVERLVASKQHREHKRQELLERKRKSSAPIVVALLPLSDAVDVQGLWSQLVNLCDPSRDDLMSSVEGRMDLDPPTTTGAAREELFALKTLTLPGKGRGRLTLLPPPGNRGDPLAIVDLARAAEVLLLVVPGGEHQHAVDHDGEAAVAILRAIGLPMTVVAVQGGGGDGAGTSAPAGMKERSAAKRRAEKAVTAQIAGEHRVFHVDTGADCQQLLRHLTEHPATVPVWRRQRPALMIQAAEFRPLEDSSSTLGISESTSGRLLLTGYVRCAGLSANQLIHVPGAGDFQIHCIEAAPEDESVSASSRCTTSLLDPIKSDAMDLSGASPLLLAQHDPEARESLARVNDTDPLDEEQTWPSEQELLDVKKLNKGRIRRRNLPAGTSDYQAAWLLDDEYGDVEDDNDDEDDEDGDAAMGSRGGDGSDEDPPELGDLIDDDDGTGTVMAMDEDDAEADEALHRELREQHKVQRQQEQEEYPDEVDVPTDVAARVRFQKYRGLKSFRSSPWDDKEWLPREYASIFAFENFKRAHKRAKAAVDRATANLDPCAVSPGTKVVVHVDAVPAAAAAAVIQRVARLTHPAAPSDLAAPLIAFGLMQHEGKMSVMHGGVKKVATYSAPICNKEKLLIVTGVRSFSAQPILSADTPGDKQKMERFLLPGRHAVASIYGPISYSPLPFLAFKLPEDDDGSGAGFSIAQGGALLAAAGTLRSCDPDRVVLKKITLTGYPVRVHKRRATVKFMFHTPDDIRWFRPVEVYTKRGRRGRITEPIGTHGAMKCLFDQPVEQRDAVCMSLYKRVFPKWPANMKFAD